MATRFHLGRNTEDSPLYPNPSANWTDTTQSIVPPNPVKTYTFEKGTPLLDRNFGTTVTIERNVLFQRHVCQLKADQTITGSQNIKMQIRAKTGSVPADPAGNFIAVDIRIMNGVNLKKQLVSLAIGATNLTLTLTNRRISTTSAAGNYTTVENDVLVMEFGIKQTLGIE